MLLYIHIPFCDSKCHYCAFNSYTDRFHLKSTYMNSLKKQLQHELRKNIDNGNETVETIFIGGGTPSTVKVEEYQEIFKILTPYISNTKEITIEANPNSANKEWLRGIFDLGVNRISFGVQSFDDEKLKFLNRAHNTNMAISAIQYAHCIGFNHINCDIIYGTALDTQELLDNDLEHIKNLPIDHVSAYDLTIEEGTLFYNKPEVKKESVSLAVELFEKLKIQGFKQYEISNFAKNDEAQSKHNLGYWAHKPYLGIGTGAVGCINNIRLYPSKNIEQYIVDPLDYEQEILSKEDVRIEKILLGLRSIIGVDLKLLSSDEMKYISLLKEDNKIIVDDEILYNNDYLLADEIALFITQDSIY
ncbi:MAG: radical SAM family heme chaperone HemW [Campylobacterota bacterium]|nr:radical SAM family heme chaperone HemW [Campylobacterota bacterium]